MADFLESDTEISGEGDVWPAWAEQLRKDGRGPWSPEILAENAERLAEFRRTRTGVPLEEIVAWIRSLDTPNERPFPAPRKL